MFEIDIKTAAIEGFMLHRSDGTTYWKLAYVCIRRGCNKVLEECFCFSYEKDMIDARKVELYCSTGCWKMDNPKKFAVSVIEFKNHMEKYEPLEFEEIDWKDIDSWIWEWEEWLGEQFDGDEVNDMVGSDMECPI